MTNSKATKKALFMSMLSLLLCFTMLMGATFAWFTDTVTSTKNIIKSGNLDVEMYWADGSAAVPTVDTDWKDASKDAIFEYDNWEPGFTMARHVKIANEGTLALKYQLQILPTGVVSKLANVIDVYFFDGAQQIENRSDLAGVEPIGTLSQVIAMMPEKTSGDLLKGESDTVTIALKMQESAGNEYQNLSIGSEFSVQLIATQLEAEADSFNNTYDATAKYPTQSTPTAMVTELSGSELNVNVNSQFTGASLNGPAVLDAGYKFEPTETMEQAKESPNRFYNVDFVVYADREVKANSLALVGYYDAWCSIIGGDWVAMTSNVDIAPNQPIRLVKDGLGQPVNYEEICTYGNDGKGFQCGVIDLDGSNRGTTITVQLVMFETYSEEECLDKFGYSSTNEETGKSTVLGTFTHTFGEPLPVNSVSTAEELQEILDNATEDVVINLASDITGDVKATQKANVDVVINGNGNKFTGVMTVFGDARQSDYETFTIKNINFVAKNGADSCIYSPERTEQNPARYSYSHNVTVENCTFTDPDGVVGCAAVRHGDGGDEDWIIKNCTVDNTMHSLIQTNNVESKLTISGCTVNSKNGINLNSCTNVEITGCTFDTKGYNVRFGVNSGGNPDAAKKFLIKDSTLKSANDDGDAVIIFRTSAANAELILENTTLTGNPEFSGNTTATTITYR